MSTFTDSLAQPGGKLQSAIIRNPLTISLDSNVFQVVELMSAARSQDNALNRMSPAEENLNSARASCVVVIDHHQIAGIITEHDIVKLSLQQISLEDISVQSCITRPVLSLLESDLTDIFLAMNLLQFHHIQQLPVLDEKDQLIGLITQESLNYCAQSAHLLKQRTAAEAMETEVAHLSPSNTLLQVAQRMVEQKTSTIVLVEEKGQAPTISYPVGILTERDLVQFQALGLNFSRKCAWEVMSQPVVSVSTDSSLWDTQRVMEQKYIQRVLVTGDRNELKGLVTRDNLVHALNPAELYKLTERLEKKILQLEQEKTLLLIDRARDLDQKVQERTKELLCKEESYETLSHQTPAGIFRTNLEGKCTYANHEWCNITGIEPDKLHGIDWLDLACEADAQMLLKEWVLCLQSNRPFILDFRIQHPVGHTNWVLCRIIPEINIKGEVTSYLGCLTAINELKQKEDVIRHHSLHDPLTQLPNRRLLKTRLAQAIDHLQNKKSKGYSILFLDLDQFKAINDQLGHWVGDRLLQQIAQVLKGHVRNKDLVAHMGGDEFLILLEELNDEHKIINIAERIIKDCQQSFQVGDYELLTGISMGIVLGQTIYKNPADLIRHAEIALAQAKKAGANQYKIFDVALHQDTIKRSTLEKDLRRAIAEEQFIIHYQPIVALRGGELIGFEALARWIHPDKGVMAPSEFIPIAEDMGLLVSLDRFILRKACEQLHVWQLQFRNCSDLKLSINLSAQTLLSHQFVHDTKRILLAVGLSNQSVLFDIKERDTLPQFHVIQDILELLHENDFQICMDDFGTGYSALGNLQKIPVDYIKVDCSLVSKMHQDNHTYQMVSTLVALCSQLGITAIAEGVETTEQLLWLQKLGCEQGQGFFFARPLPPPDIEARFLQKLHQKS